MRVLVVFGTRAEIVKLAPVIAELRKRSTFEVSVCHTGQHGAMAAQAMKTFEIVPDYWLDTGPQNKGLVVGLATILTELEHVLDAQNWDLTIVQGDTTSALAGALSAFYHKIPVAHVEAGLRTWDKTQPWPEEMNRRLISRVAEWHFAPTEKAFWNIYDEHCLMKRAFKVGNTVIDALLWVKERYGLVEDMIPGSILITAHRRENWAAGIANVCKAIKRLAAQDEELLFIWPMHPNRIIRDVVERELGKVGAASLKEPFSYAGLVRQMMTAQIILTDSGGIQEEAPTLNTPVLILRDKTERPEAVECGAAKLVGTDPGRIVAEVTRLLTDKEEYERMASAKNPFGDGHAAERIADALEKGCI